MHRVLKSLFSFNKMEKSLQRAHTQRCSAPKCQNSRANCPGMSFFRFPKDKERSQKWIANSNREDLLDKDTVVLFRRHVICAEHFEATQFMNAATRNRLVWNAVPTVFGGATLWQPTDSPLPCAAAATVASNSNCEPRREDKAHGNIPCQFAPVSATPCIHIEHSSNDDEVTEDSINPVKAPALHLQDGFTPSAVDRNLTQDVAPNTGFKKSCRMASMVLTSQQVKLMKMRLLVNRQRTQLCRLKKQVKFLKAQVQSGKEGNEIENLIRHASKYMTGICLSFFSNQLRVAARKNNAKRWERDDQLFAMSLYYQSPEAYRLCGKVFGLPSVRTLQRWMKSFKEGQASLQEDIELQAFKEKLLKKPDGGRACGQKGRLKRERTDAIVDRVDIISDDEEKSRGLARKPVPDEVCLNGPQLFTTNDDDDDDDDDYEKAKVDKSVEKASQAFATLGPLTIDTPLSLQNDTNNLKIVTLDLADGEVSDNIFPLFSADNHLVAGRPVRDGRTDNH